MKLVLAPDDRLKQVCRPFDFEQPELDPVVFYHQLDTLRVRERGMGLAAPQIGVDLRVFVIMVEAASAACFNPRIIAKAGGKGFAEEGCLSFPGRRIIVGRHREIQVAFQNERGQQVLTWLADWEARCFQHELDHLDGITFDTRENSVAKAMAPKAKGRGRR